MRISDWRADVMPKHLSPWAIEAKEHLLKYRPKMASELQSQGKLDDWAQSAANRAVEESVESTYNGMDPLEADRQAKLNHYLLPSEEDMPELGTDPNALPEPASLITTPRVNPRKRPQKQKGPKVN
jgi:ribonuclease D